MVKPFHYWTMPGIDGKGGSRIVQVAKALFQQEFPEPARFSSQAIDNLLWERWQTAIKQRDHSSLIAAELCLRCRIAHLSCRSFWKIFRNFELYDRAVVPKELFSRLDYDDGKVVSLLGDSLKKAQNSYQPLTLEILQDYRPDRNGKISLPQLVELKVRQDTKLKQFLLEHDILLYSQWRLLNRANLMQITSVDRQITRTFRAVYQRDRRQQPGSRNDGQCPKLTFEQLEEMLRKLQSLGISINSPHELEQALEKIANYLRQAEICRLKGFCSTDSLDQLNPEGEQRQQPEDEQSPDPLESAAELEFQFHCERWNLLAFCQQQLDTSLDWAVAQAVSDRIAFLAKKPKRADLAGLVKPALRLLYIESRSQAYIANQLGLKGQHELSLMLEPKKMAQIMRDRTVEHLHQAVLDKAIQLGFTQDPPEIEYLNGLTQAITDFVNDQVFQAALKELSTAKNRSMNSPLAQRISLYLGSSKENDNA